VLPLKADRSLVKIDRTDHLSTTVGVSAPSHRTIRAPHVHVNQTLSPSTPPSSSPQYSCLIANARRSASRATRRAYRTAPQWQCPGFDTPGGGHQEHDASSLLASARLPPAIFIEVPRAADRARSSANSNPPCPARRRAAADGEGLPRWCAQRGTAVVRHRPDAAGGVACTWMGRERELRVRAPICGRTTRSATGLSCRPRPSHACP